MFQFFQMYNKSMKNVLTIWLIAFGIGLTTTQNCSAQQGEKQLGTAVEVDEPGKCFIYSDSGKINKVTVSELKMWCEKAPFSIGCENGKEYQLKAFEFTTLTMKPFENKSYGVGDQHLMPILGIKALDKLKKGDTVIFQGVIATGKEGKELAIPTISIKIEE